MKLFFGGRRDAGVSLPAAFSISSRASQKFSNADAASVQAHSAHPAALPKNKRAKSKKKVRSVCESRRQPGQVYVWWIHCVLVT